MQAHLTKKMCSTQDQDQGSGPKAWAKLVIDTPESTYWLSGLNAASIAKDPSCEPVWNLSRRVRVLSLSQFAHFRALNSNQRLGYAPSIGYCTLYLYQCF